MNRKTTLFGWGLLCIWLFSQCTTTQIIYSNVSVPEEGGIRFEKLTDENRDIVNGISTRNEYGKFEWWVNPCVAISPDGRKMAYLSYYALFGVDQGTGLLLMDRLVRDGSVSRQSLAAGLCLAVGGRIG